MGRRVVAHNIQASRHIDGANGSAVYGWLAFHNLANMDNQPTNWTAYILNINRPAITMNGPGVADLSACLHIEGCRIKDHLKAISNFGTGHRLIVSDQRQQSRRALH